MLAESSTSCTLPFLQLVLLDWFLTLGEQFLGVYTVIYRLSLVDYGHPLHSQFILEGIEINVNVSPSYVTLSRTFLAIASFPHIVIRKVRNRKYKKTRTVIITDRKYKYVIYKHQIVKSVFIGFSFHRVLSFFFFSSKHSL